MSLGREDRRHEVGGGDQRNSFERDRDRVLYSSAFRRLAGITQIVRAGESDVFHTRQQHTMKVAQVGRRLAEMLIKQQAELSATAGLHPEVVEAAALAHDLGHPPFGHIGEHTLNELVVSHGDDNGFEGNAQTFRIVTKLAIRFFNADGLDLCRATLAACLKYPWFRDVTDPSRTTKWGAYDVDREDFLFARAMNLSHNEKTVEAQLMDWADDIAYSVHDLEDFHRCGVIPWRRILYQNSLTRTHLVPGSLAPTWWS
jgi:dGTPase